LTPLERIYCLRSSIIKPIFKRRTFLGLRIVVLVLLSLTVMTLDHRTGIFQQTRSALSLVVAPVQYLVDWPVKWIKVIESNVTSQHAILEENARLRAHQLLLEAKLQKLLSLERENAQLRDLLRSSVDVGGTVLVAQLLAVDLDPFSQQVVLDKGKHDGIYVGQPVFDAYGVLGQVIAVGPITSRVLLVTDNKSAVPVENHRNGIRAIVAGTGHANKLQVLHIPATTDIRKDDLFVTSGLGLRYPVGYPVGKVVDVVDVPGERFVRIRVTPSAHIYHNRQVLLVWPKRAMFYSHVKQKQRKPVAS